MIGKTKVLICGEEHGSGDVTFPAVSDLTGKDFIAEYSPSVAQLRGRAKEVGWGRYKGEDYCPMCWISLNAGSDYST